MSIKILANRRRHIFIGNTALDFITTCTGCDRAAVRKGKCIKHYTEYAKKKYIEQVQALEKLLPTLSIVLLTVSAR